jgi:hypothetical protein
MFRCDTCHTEYGGIRGVPAGTCPRCRERRTSLARPVAMSPSLAAFAQAPRPSASTWSTATAPMAGEIARLDRLVRF